MPKTKGSKACTRCKQKKSKCDSMRPCCTRCKDLGFQKCEYPQDRRAERWHDLDGKKLFTFKSCNTVEKGKNIPSNKTLQPQQSNYSLSSPLAEIGNNTNMEISPVKSSKSVPRPLSALLKGPNINVSPSNSVNSMTPSIDIMCQQNDIFRSSDSFLPPFNSKRDSLKEFGVPFNPVFNDLDVPDTQTISQNTEIFLPWSDLIPNIFPNEMNMGEFICYLEADFPVNAFNFDEVATLSPNRILIDAVFNNKMHTPPAVNHDMIINIDLMQNRSEDEEFLYTTILAMGALTLAKRDLVSQRQETVVSFSSASDNGSLELKLPAMASEAFDHYCTAQKLIPRILERPSKNGFRGLALMANFMSILLTPETQMFITYHALQIAISIGLTQAVSLEPKSEDESLAVAFWGLWCTSSMLSTFHARSPPLMRGKIATTPNIKMRDAYVERFFEIRIRLAALTGLLTKVNGAEGNIYYHKLNKELAILGNEVSWFEEMLPNDQAVFNRHDLLVIELKCWKAYVSMLLNLPALVNLIHNRAVIEAKNIIKDLWVYYYSYRQSFLPNLDWNFSYPIRNSTLCTWIACMILTQFINSLGHLTFDYVEYKLGIQLLIELTGIIPINKYLLKDLEEMKLKKTGCNKWLFRSV